MQKAKKSTPAEPKTSGHAVNIEKAKVFLKEAGLQGATVQELIDKVQPGAAVFPTRNAMNSDSQIIAMPGDLLCVCRCFRRFGRG